jgi:hypothetical protein
MQLCAAALCAAEPPPAFTSAGESFAAAGVVKIDDEAIHFAGPDGEKVVAIGDFAKWGVLRDSAAGTQVVLADGSVIVAGEVRIADEKLVVEANLFGEPEDFKLQGTLRLPLDVVRAVLFRVPIEPLARDQLLAKVFEATGNADQLLLANGDVLAGTVKKLEPRAGEGDEPGPLAATIETAAGEVTIGPDSVEGRLSDKIAALIFNPQLVRSPAERQTRLVVGFADGSRLYARRVTAKGEQASLMLTCGAVVVSHPDENIWSQITSLQTLDGGAKYLSQLKPLGYKHVPLVGTAWPLGVDENVLGGNLRSGGGMFLRGIGMHAASAVAFDLDRPYAKFQAELALDDSAGDSGSVVFRLVSIEEKSRRLLYESPIIRGGDAPTPISIDVTGVKRLALLVEPADHGDSLDRANWLDARLIP